MNTPFRCAQQGGRGAVSLLLFILTAVGMNFNLFADEFDAATYDQIEFVRIPAGSFEMGTSDSARAALIAQTVWTRFNECECPAHRVRISHSFWLSKCEITQKQWKTAMGKNPSAFKGDSLPIESVSWNDVQRFITKLNQNGHGKYRLPTEAEWEYCCQAGGTNGFAVGIDFDAIDRTNVTDYAWCRGNSENKTHPVGTKRPNAWGLHDMQGNVWEWCQDWYQANYYSQGSANNPVNREASAERVFRGGSWFLDWPALRPACRSGNWPDFKSQYVGFRLVRGSDDEP